MRIPIAFGPAMRFLMAATGLLARWSWIDVNAETVTVQMSYGFRGSFDRSAIRSVRPLEGRRPLSIGVHGWGGRWLVNGTREGLVVIDLDPPARARVLGVPVKLRQLIVSVADPDLLVSALG